MAFMSEPHPTEQRSGGSYSRAGAAEAPAAPGAPPPGVPADHAGLQYAVIGTAWPAILAGGIGCLVAGVLLLAWPKQTLVVAAVLLGVALVVVGLQRLVHGFSSRDESGGQRTASVVIGLLALIAGLYLIRHYHVTVALMALFLGVFWVINGIAEMGAGLFGQLESGRGLAVLSGALSFVAGLIVLFWPTISLTVLVVVMGIWLIIYSIFLISAALRLRRVKPAMDGGP